MRASPCFQTILAAVGVICSAICAVTAETAQPARPNIVLIVADDMGNADMSCQGATGFKTPHLDRMGAEAEPGELKDRLRAKTSRLQGRSLEVIVADVNQTLRGWYGYFQHSKGNVFASVDGFMRRRLRSLL